MQYVTNELADKPTKLVKTSPFIYVQDFILENFYYHFESYHQKVIQFYRLHLYNLYLFIYKNFTTPELMCQIFLIFSSNEIYKFSNE